MLLGVEIHYANFLQYAELILITHPVETEHQQEVTFHKQHLCRPTLQVPRTGKHRVQYNEGEFPRELPR